jgi:hypothetical protein
MSTKKTVTMVVCEGPREPSADIGKTYKFNYPSAFTSLPDYTAHAGQDVVVVRELTEDEADPADPEEGITQMYRIRAADGWEGDAWAEELDPGWAEVAA